ncbi:ceramide synthase 2-like, partial [Polyodon spathula]|uniref:ceramide synthase 2-like n=1 Tax=Polyodon spathula TaxID=7913 RepID=UPI001B7F1406
FFLFLFNPFQSAKIFNYAGWKKTCNAIFIVFAAVFIITRLVIFPFWILHCTVVYPLSIYPPFFVYYFFNGLLMVLQLLHLFWAALILRMAHKFVTGKFVDDERSDKEETDNSEEEEEEEEKKKKRGRVREVKETPRNGPVQNGHPTTTNNNNRKNN